MPRGPSFFSAGKSCYWQQVSLGKSICRVTRIKGEILSELRPSIPRTYTQAVLRVVSIVMAILGGLILLAGGLVFADSALAGMDELWSSITYVAIILARRC